MTWAQKKKKKSIKSQGKVKKKPFISFLLLEVYATSIFLVPALYISVKHDDQNPEKKNTP
jgi:hypothetical protein